MCAGDCPSASDSATSRLVEFLRKPARYERVILKPAFPSVQLTGAADVDDGQGHLSTLGRRPRGGPGWSSPVSVPHYLIAPTTPYDMCGSAENPLGPYVKGGETCDSRRMDSSSRNGSEFGHRTDHADQGPKARPEVTASGGKEGRTQHGSPFLSFSLVHGVKSPGSAA